MIPTVPTTTVSQPDPGSWADQLDQLPTLAQDNRPTVRILTAETVGIAARAEHFHRKRNIAETFDRHGYAEIAEKLRDCQETQTLVCCHACHAAWWVLTRCRLRVCPLCAYAVAKERGKFVLAMTRHMAHPKLLTLTMPLWTANPRDGIAYIRTCWNKLRRNVALRNVRGGAYQVEVILSPKGAHVHFHAIIDAPFLPYQVVFSAWTRILGVAHAEVYVQSATTNASRTYAVKYPVKSGITDTDLDSIVDWYEATKGLRLFATFGQWFNKSLQDILPPEPIPRPLHACPFCGAEHTLFYARDGPRIYGNDGWRDVRPLFMTGYEDQKPLPGALEALRHHSQERLAI